MSYKPFHNFINIIFIFFFYLIQIIRKNRTKPDVAEAPTPNILSDGEFRGFWIRWNNGTITVGREGEPAPFLSWADVERVPIEYIGVCTGWGASGNWVIQPPGMCNIV